MNSEIKQKAQSVRIFQENICAEKKWTKFFYF